MQLHDTHVHLDLLLQQLAVLPHIDRNTPQNIEYNHSQLDQLLQSHLFVIQATLTGRNFLLTKSLFHTHDKVKYLLGMHPEEVNHNTNVSQLLSEHRIILNENKNFIPLVGIGEIGLDYYWTQDKSVQKKQVELFESHIALALEYGLPFAVHIRDEKGKNQCMLDGLAILNNFPSIQNRFVIHCFTGTQDDADQILGMGGLLGFGGITTYNSGKSILEIAKNCPADRLLLETDLPFLSPTPKRGGICLPIYIEYIAQTIAAVRQTSTQQLCDTALNNAKRLFSL